MNLSRIITQIALADFRERTRQSSFWVTLLMIIAVTYFFLPAVNATIFPYLNMGGYRPLYSSAWIGVATALLMGEFFPLFGFYLVKNTIERDRKTGVGEIIATTPIRKSAYLFGKWLSNLAYFTAILLVTILASLILQLIRAEDLHIDLWGLIAPFIFVNLPQMAVMAALAVLFESISVLRGGFGNLVFYLVYGILIATSDLQGIKSVWPSVYQSCAAIFQHCNPQRQIDIDGFALSTLPTFQFHGVSWTYEIIASRLVWIAVAMGITWLASAFFHRFDSARVGRGLIDRVKTNLYTFVSVPDSKSALQKSEPASPQHELSVRFLSPLKIEKRPSHGSLFLNMFKAEFRLNFKGISWFWLLVAAGLIAASAILPLETARLIVLPLAWVWPVLIWASLGAREVFHHTNPFLSSIPFPLRRQLPVVWMVGFSIAILMGSPVLIRTLMTGNLIDFSRLLVGALFIPSMALAFGCWTGSGKLFQAAYLFLWYLAAVQGLFFLDFMGHLPETTHLSPLYLVITILLLAAAVLGRKRQLHQN
jgi:hypothetical protein